MPGEGKIARVAVDDDRWLAFRQAALTQGITVSAYLGRLVERELGRRQERPIAAIPADASESDRALAGLAEVRASIDELEGLAKKLASTAVAHGGSWGDVAKRLRIEPEQARAAYEE